MVVGFSNYQAGQVVARVLNVQILSNTLGTLISVLVIFSGQRSNLVQRMGMKYVLVHMLPKLVYSFHVVLIYLFIYSCIVAKGWKFHGF